MRRDGELVKVIISTGQGRLHLVSAALAVASKGVQTAIICGWVPRNANGIMVRLASKLVGRDLSAGMRSRQVESHIKCGQCAFAEFFDQIIRMLFRVLHLSSVTASVLGWKLYGWQSKRYIKDADIIHIRSGAGHGGAIKRAKALRMKVIVDHSIAHPQFMEDNLKSEYEKNGIPFTLGMNPFWEMVDEDCRWADVVLVNSDFVKDTLVQAGYDSAKIRVVYLGVRDDFVGLRTAKFSDACSDSPLRLLFTGGFGFRKGGEYILEACRILKERGIKYVMDVVGDHSGAKGLIEKYSKYDLPITFHGPKPQDELKDYLTNSDIYVFPSLAEGCAKSGMEAMAAGMCVIGTHESGFPITDGENGYIVPSKNAQALAEKIAWLNEHRDEIDRTGSNAAGLVAEKYSWEKYGENVKNLYEELLNG